MQTWKAQYEYPNPPYGGFKGSTWIKNLGKEKEMEMETLGDVTIVISFSFPLPKSSIQMEPEEFLLRLSCW